MSVCILGLCFFFVCFLFCIQESSNIIQSEHWLNYMFLVYLDILCMLQLNSGWSTLIFIQIKNGKSFQRGKLLKCEALFLFKLKNQLPDKNLKFCLISGRDQVFLHLLYLHLLRLWFLWICLLRLMKQWKNFHCPWRENMFKFELPLMTYLSK